MAVDDDDDGNADADDDVDGGGGGGECEVGCMCYSISSFVAVPVYSVPHFPSQCHVVQGGSFIQFCFELFRFLFVFFFLFCGGVG
mgnify:CR=1 FL=1